MGTVKKEGSTETMVITVLKTIEGSKYLGVIRTQSGDHKFFIPSALVNFKLKGRKHVPPNTTEQNDIRPNTKRLLKTNF